MKHIFYHGTSKEAGEKILKEGFKTDCKNNWDVKSKPGFVYFSTAYAPFYAMNASEGKELAIVKVEVEDIYLYPEDDFLMRALGKPKYTQAELDAVDFKKYKQFWKESVEYMGNAAARPEKVTVLGVGFFDGDMLLMKCDPVISPTNYKIMGQYYRELTEWLYAGKSPKDFKSFMG